MERQQTQLMSMGTAIRPVERHGMEAISFFLYDPVKGAIMGRTPKSWALIIIFYCIYYSCLAGFWYACLLIFFHISIQDPKEIGEFAKPRWLLDESRIGVSPALGIRPNQTDKLMDSCMILFNKDSEADVMDGKQVKMPGWGPWKQRTDDFLANYEDCKDGDFCKTDLGECVKDNYGWDKGTPCIILKLNKIYGLIPDWYNDTSKLPNDPEKNNVFPTKLKTHIDGLAKEKDKRNQVWVECKGESPADEENIGPMTYFPTDRGFPKKYFPYVNQKGYKSPLIAVRFDDPKIGQLLHIECRAWAKNIGYNRMDRLGKAHFELMVYSKDINPSTVPPK